MTTLACNHSHRPLEFEAHKFGIEASDLGIPPGVVPRSLTTDMGNKLPFILVGTEDHGTLIYRQELGCISLKVFND